MSKCAKGKAFVKPGLPQQFREPLVAERRARTAAAMDADLTDLHDMVRAAKLGRMQFEVLQQVTELYKDYASKGMRIPAHHECRVCHDKKANVPHHLLCTTRQRTPQNIAKLVSSMKKQFVQISAKNSNGPAGAIAVLGADRCACADVGCCVSLSLAVFWAHFGAEQGSIWSRHGFNLEPTWTESGADLG